MFDSATIWLRKYVSPSCWNTRAGLSLLVTDSDVVGRNIVAVPPSALRRRSGPSGLSEMRLMEYLPAGRVLLLTTKSNGTVVTVVSWESAKAFTEEVKLASAITSAIANFMWSFLITSLTLTGRAHIYSNHCSAFS